jgi:Spy/CpxP family protein refolding chaperone
MTKLLSAVVVCAALTAFAGPKGAGPGDDGAARRAEHERKMRTMMVVGMAEALQLNEQEALRMSEKIKVLDEKRKPLREAMGESMRTIKAAADGDATALTQVDAAMDKVLSGRQQMAALDKEMFQVLGKDLTPQKRAQLAVFLAHLGKGGREFGKGGRNGGPGGPGGPGEE